jgi:hypothetical protein
MTMKSFRLLAGVTILILLLSVVACKGDTLEEEPTQSSPSSTEELNEPEPKDEVAGPAPEDVYFQDFDQGGPDDWEYSPEWQFEGGNATSSGSGQYLFWFRHRQNFMLQTRVYIEEESVFGLFFRSLDEAAYQLFIEPNGVELMLDVRGNPETLKYQGRPLESGWHTLELTVDQDSASLSWNEELVLEIGGLEHTAPGAIGFMNHSDGELAIDFVEVHTLGMAGDVATGEGAGETPAGEYLSLPSVVISKPPVANLISIGTPDQEFLTTITGSAGAVEPGSLVGLACLETTRVYFVDAEEDGSFQEQIFAPPGSTVQIKQSYSDFYNEEERNAVLMVGKSGELIAEWFNATTGTILRVPDNVDNLENQIPFSVSGNIGARDGYWILEGTITPLNDSPQNVLLRIEATLSYAAQNLMQLIDPADFHLGLHFTLARHFDENGNHLPPRQFLISDFLSPTGFPIYHGEIPWSPMNYLHEVRQWQRVSENTITTEIEFDYGTDYLPLNPGYYGIRLELGGYEEFEPIPLSGPTMRSGMLYANGGTYLPLIKLGDPPTPHLNWGLLTDTLHEATRGTVTREDMDRIRLLSMISQQDHYFVVEKDDPKTGQPMSYRLEPYLPLIAYGDRGLPNPPTIDFAFPSGELEVIVHRPDGEIDLLGPAPFVQSTNTTPSYDYGKVLDYSNGGGAVQDVYQLTTLNSDFEYVFDQYGHYVIEMTGTIDDVVGNTYSGGGTYDVYVAKPLKLYNGMLPSTPFQEGDSFSPALQVYPRVPAEVEISHQFLPNSNLEDAIKQTFSGTANQYGYFYPQAGYQPMTYDDGGEYRVDITAQYWDEDGALWMGSATWGNVVENVDTPLIAHGIRGMDSPKVNSLWFFHKNTEIEGVAHTFYPYYSGDVFWGIDLPEGEEIKGEDAILPGVTLEDTSGEIYATLRNNWHNRAHGVIDMGEGIDSVISLGEVRAFTTTSTGWDLAWAPDKIDQYGYVYQSSQRPGARVHESLTEGGIPIGYWRYQATYGDQVGVEGDLPNDIKWQFGGVVFRDLSEDIHEYAIYASLWVLLPSDDPQGGRVTPPFQGATGGPNGGPIFTLKGEEVDLFFLPRSGFPGQMLEVGDVFSFSGHVGPPLDSKLTVTVTSPTGEEHVISGQANKIGYFYRPETDFTVTEPGAWSVEVEVIHDGMTSSGPTMEPFPSGSVPGSEEGSYHFYVVPKDTKAPELESPAPGFLQFSSFPISPIQFTGSLPDGMENAAYAYTIAMPGFILEEGSGITSGKTFSITYDPLTAFDEPRPGLADQIWIAVLFEKNGDYVPLTITLHGEEVFDR